MKNIIPLAVVLAASSWLASPANAAAPIVSNVRATQTAGSKLVEITYDVADPDSATVNIFVAVSNDGGLTYTVPAITLTGDLGPGVRPGTGKRVTWNAGLDWGGRFTTAGRVRVTAQDSAPDDGAPAGMALIPAGGFQMGDPPSRTVFVSGFYMDRYEVSFDLWNQVLQWAISHSYSFQTLANGVAGNHPVYAPSWYDAVKWCNARSEMLGRTPVYYANTNQTTIYRSGNWDLNNEMVKWDANGYRLPTEAEWEKAARGGLEGHEFPWPSFDRSGLQGFAFIDGSKANFANSGDPFDSRSPGTTPVGYYNGQQTPKGVDMANGYGLYDMAGNMFEWCWDPDRTPLGTTDPMSLPTSGTSRAGRGGYWNTSASDTRSLRCASRSFHAPYSNNWIFGFRSVLRQP